MNNCLTIVVDNHLDDHVIQSRSLSVDDGRSVVADESAVDYLPEECMEKLEDCLGDGLASVSVSGDMAHNDYGTKAGTHVSVRVTCGNNESDILKAHAIARDIVECLVDENLDRMMQLLDQRETKKEQLTKVNSPQPLPTGRVAPARAATSLQQPQPLGKPNFRR